MTINQIRQHINDLTDDLQTAQRELSTAVATIYQVELNSKEERPTTKPRDYMAAYQKMTTIEEELVKQKAELARLNASVEVLDGLTIAASIPKLKLMRERLNRIQSHIDRNQEDETWHRRNDGPNTASYYEVVRLNFKREDLITSRDELRAEINELEEAIDRCNARELELPL